MEIKVFRMDDREWYAGETAADAIRAMAENLGCVGEAELRAEEYLEEGFPIEMPDSAMDRLNIHDEEEGIKRTLREEIAHMIETGCSFPCMFASTEY